MIALANVVPDPVLYLNAADNPAHPKAWKNLGTEGGELLEADKAPTLEEGTIKIPALGINEQKVKYYTTKESLQTWGGPPAKNTPLFLRIGRWNSFVDAMVTSLLRSIILRVSRTVREKASRASGFGSLVVRILTSLSMPRAESKVFNP